MIWGPFLPPPLINCNKEPRREEQKGEEASTERAAKSTSPPGCRATPNIPSLGWKGKETPRPPEGVLSQCPAPETLPHLSKVLVTRPGGEGRQGRKGPLLGQGTGFGFHLRGLDKVCGVLGRASRSLCVTGCRPASTKGPDLTSLEINSSRKASDSCGKGAEDLQSSEFPTL